MEGGDGRGVLTREWRRVGGGQGGVSCVAMAAGFLTFGGNSNGLILNSYAATDKLAVFGRLGIGCSILFGYPLCFNGFRTGLLAALGVKNASQGMKDTIAVCLLLFSTSVAMVLRSQSSPCPHPPISYHLPCLPPVPNKGALMVSRL